MRPEGHDRQAPGPPSTTCLVTGGAGFIGSHLADALLARGRSVVVLDDLSTGRLSNIEHLLPHPHFRFVQASIAEDAVLDRLASGSDVIFHLAAAVGVQLVVKHPARAIETNVLGTEAVLRAALRHNCRVLIASSSEVYGKGSRIPFHEEDDIVLGPTSKGRWGYAASKMVDEFLGFAYHYEHGLAVVPFRLFNTAGPRQLGRYGMVLPRFVAQALRGEAITVFGDGSQTRCFCHVEDAVRAIIGLSQHPEAPGRVFNIGGREEVTIRDLAERVRTLTNSTSEIVCVPYTSAYPTGFEDLYRRVPDTTRIERLLGWRPEIGLNDLIARTRDAMTHP